MGVTLLMFGWRFGVVALQHFGAETIADQFTAIRQFRQDVIPNHANTRLTFCEDTETGVGIYFCATDGGSPRLLCEKKENPLQWRRFSVLGWSPDDRLLACALPDEKQAKEAILIFDGGTGEPLSHLEVDQGFEQFAWLTSGSFAYSTPTDVRVVINTGAGWAHKRNFEKVAAHLENLTAISDHTVAWRDAADLWLLDVNSGSPPQILWAATTNNLVEFTYNRPAGDFLLNCSDQNGQYLLLFNPAANRTVDAGRVSSQADYIHNAVWTGRETAYAFVSNTLAGSEFCLKTEDGLNVVTVPWDGGVGSGGAGGFSLNGNKLYFSGNTAGNPPAIWEYDLHAKSYKSIYSIAAKGVKYRTFQAPASGSFTNASGAQRFYQLWTPKNAEPGKNHPLLLAEEINTWFPYFQIAADCGFNVAVVSHTWNDNQNQTWGEDVQGLYDRLASQPGIDPHKVYLFAYSGDTYRLSGLFDARPDLWKGAVLFSPVAFPNASDLRHQNIFAIDGRYDSGAVSRLAQYQNQAATFGTSATICILANAGHIPESGLSERQRARQFADFLSAHH